MNSAASELAIGQIATLACVLEATAPKPGNVHRGADFDDLSYPDFLVSGVAIAPCMEAAWQRPLGETILHSVAATRRLVNTNSNLGTILLLAPLASVPRSQPLRAGVQDVLQRLTPRDAELTYQAIALAQPGGLGRVAEADLAAAPPSDLIYAMQLAAQRDLVARQYVSGFAETLDFALPALQTGLEAYGLAAAIVQTHLRLMREFPDSLIARKAGLATAQQAAAYAADVLRAGQPGEPGYEEALADFDFWLRSAGRRRNPGTTADLVAAALFAALRDGIIQPPLRMTPQVVE